MVIRKQSQHFFYKIFEHILGGTSPKQPNQLDKFLMNLWQHVVQSDFFSRSYYESYEVVEKCTD